MAETSIIIRTLNEEKRLGDLLQAIGKQDYQDYEVIIVDSGSTDRTLEIAQQFSAKIIKIESRDFTFGYALNIGCRTSSGKYLVFVSAHVIPVGNIWLSRLIAPLSDEKVAMVYGRQMGGAESKFSEKMDFHRMFGSSSLNSNIPLIYANNANSAIRKELWEKNPFDEYLFGLEDIEWAKHFIEKGYHVHYEPNAAIYHIHEEQWHQVFNRYRREAIAGVRIGLKHPPQARLGIGWMGWNIFLDLATSFPNLSFGGIEEIIRFRYYQWKASNIGWHQGKDIDFKREKNNIFFPQENKAVIIREKCRAEIEAMPLPEMKPGDILVKVEYVGVCRTDLEVYEGSLGYYRDGIAQYPIVPGHEFSGTIMKVGSNNKFQERFKVGQRVVGECILSRGEGVVRKEVGVINYNGAYAQYVIMPGDFIHKVPENLDLKTVALTEPLAVVLRALRRIEYRLFPGAAIAIVGAGSIGNLCAQVLHLRGYQVYAFDRNPERLGLLKSIIAGISSEIGGVEKFDVIIEATGSKIILERILKESRVNSTILLLGFPYGGMEYNFEDVVGKEKVIIGSVGADREDFSSALDLLPQLTMDVFTKTVMPLERFAEAWQHQRSAKYLKVLLQP